MHLARKTRCSSFLLWSAPDRLRQSPATVGHAQHGLCAAAVEKQIRLFQQAAQIGARIMARHRMIRMPKKRFTIFGGNACCAQTARERMPQVVDAN